MRLATGNPVYRRVFDFWLKVFALSFGMGVVTGIVMAFQFGTNWSVLAERTGSIQGPLLGYEGFTAFMLEATFFGVMLLGRDRVAAVVLLLRLLHGLARHHVVVVLDPRQQQLDAGAARPRGRRRQDRAGRLVGDRDSGRSMLVRWPHMLLAAFLTTGMSVIATGAWYLLRGRQPAEARVMLHWGLGLVAVIIPVQLFFGHLTGTVRPQLPAGQIRRDRGALARPSSRPREVLIAIPDRGERNATCSRSRCRRLGSFIASGNWDRDGDRARELSRRRTGRRCSSRSSTFRLMVGMGLIMLAVSWFGNCRCAGAAGWRRRAGSSGRRSCRFRPASSPCSAAGSPPRSAASRGWSTACCAPRTR